MPILPCVPATVVSSADGKRNDGQEKVNASANQRMLAYGFCPFWDAWMRGGSPARKEERKRERAKARAKIRPLFHPAKRHCEVWSNAIIRCCETQGNASKRLCRCHAMSCRHRDSICRNRKDKETKQIVDSKSLGIGHITPHFHHPGSRPAAGKNFTPAQAAYCSRHSGLCSRHSRRRSCPRPSPRSCPRSYRQTRRCPPHSGPGSSRPRTSGGQAGSSPSKPSQQHVCVMLETEYSLD